MAAADYYLCDACGCKTFYDANLPHGYYGEPRKSWKWPDGNVGFMLVLCEECATKHSRTVENILQQLKACHAQSSTAAV